MTYDPQKHHRRSIRLQGYDYAQAGAYYVTMVAEGRERLFGEVVDGEMRLNAAGQMIEKWWLELAHKFPTISLGAYVIMPNHSHGIIIINDVRADVGADLRVGPALKDDNVYMETGAHAGAPRPDLPTIVQWFKTMTTNEYMRGVKQLEWPAFNGKLWQRNYYEHIIRNDEDYNRIHLYIESNPLNWSRDKENFKTPTPKGNLI
jgi:putative transposase